MDPQDHLIQRPDGLCAVCGDSVPPDDVRLLARRDDLAFLQIRCGCGSTTLAFVMAGAIDIAAAEASPGSDSRSPVSSDDVLDMHTLLESWQGGIRELLGNPARSGPRA
jgi:hypothetical protein